MSDWFKSSYTSETGNCVEVRRASLTGPKIQVRDSKNVTGPVVGFSREAWLALLGSVTEETELP